jgi:uncharacterized protein YeaO (DUF488 family)
MVMGHKRGELTNDAYVQAYTEILRRLDRTWWAALEQHFRGQQILTLKCYCRDGAFCHTHLIIEHAVREYPDLFYDAR